jgi:hypothetical protein
MKGLIPKPDDPLTGFLRGAGVTALTIGIPLISQIVFMSFRAGKPLIGVALSLGITCVASLVGGTLLALWRLIQCAAYDRLSDS